MSQTYAAPYPFFAPPPRPAPGQTETFLAYMQDGKIFRQAPDGPQPVGVTTKTHDDLQADYDSIYATCQEYYDALVKAGIITPEPTQEELLRRQAEQLKAQAEQLAEASRVIAEGAASQQALSAMVAALRGEISALRGRETQEAQHDHASEPCEPPAGAVSGLAGQDTAGVEDRQQLQQLPQRPAAGHRRAKSDPAGPPAGARLPAKRAGGKRA